MDKVLLRSYGIDYDKGLVNCMGDAQFYKLLLSMFLDDDCFARGVTAYNSKDYKELFNCMHELKGVSGNAALDELYEAIVPLVDLLRTELSESNEEQINTLFVAAEKSYKRAIEGITKASID